MDLSTGLCITAALWLVVCVPYALSYIRRGRAHGHMECALGKPRGPSDIGPDLPVGNVPGNRVFRQTRPGADDARGARYCMTAGPRRSTRCEDRAYRKG